MDSGPEISETNYRQSGVTNAVVRERLLIVGSIFLSLLILMVSFSIAGLSPGSLVVSVAIPVGAVLAGTVAITRPRWIFYGFISLAMIFPHELESTFVPLGFMKVYPQDLVFGFLTGLWALLWISGKATLHDVKFNRLMVLYLALGGFAAAVGLLVTRNEYDNVLGDLRRSFFYFLAYFFAMVLTRNSKDVEWLKWALLAGAIGAIGRGFFQIITGAFESRRLGDAVHILNHFEVTFSTFAVYLALATVAIQKRLQAFWIGIALAGCAIVVLGNFRTCWIGFLIGLGVLAFIFPVKQRKRLAVAAAIAALLGAVSLAVLWEMPVEETHSTIGENISAKADIGAALNDPNVGWRLDSYRNAIDLWLTQPILGRGLGEELEFITATSTGGSMMAMGHRVHNSYIWLLMSLGAVGFSLLAYIHYRFAIRVFSALKIKELPSETRVFVSAAMAFYATILASAGFDVYLESAPPITVISVTMAASLLYIRYSGVKTLV